MMLQHAINLRLEQEKRGRDEQAKREQQRKDDAAAGRAHMERLAERDKESFEELLLDTLSKPENLTYLNQIVDLAYKEGNREGEEIKINCDHVCFNDAYELNENLRKIGIKIGLESCHRYDSRQCRIKIEKDFDKESLEKLINIIDKREKERNSFLSREEKLRAKQEELDEELKKTAQKNHENQVIREKIAAKCAQEILNLQEERQNLTTEMEQFSIAQDDLRKVLSNQRNQLQLEDPINNKEKIRQITREMASNKNKRDTIDIINQQKLEAIDKEIQNITLANNKDQSRYNEICGPYQKYINRITMELRGTEADIKRLEERKLPSSPSQKLKERAALEEQALIIKKIIKHKLALPERAEKKGYYIWCHQHRQYAAIMRQLQQAKQAFQENHLAGGQLRHSDKSPTTLQQKSSSPQREEKCYERKCIVYRYW